MVDARQFLDIVNPMVSKDNGFRLATVQTVETEPYPGVTVQFDGEGTPAAKVYPTLTTVGIVPDARVLLVPVSTSMVVVGALGEGYTPPDPTPGLIVTTYDVGKSDASQTLTTTLADVTTTNLDITTTYPNAVAMVSATWDFRCLNATTTTNSTFVGTLNFDGTDQAKQGLVYVVSNIRLASTATYKISIPTPGTYTIKQRARITVALAGGATPSVMTQHTGWTATVYETP